MDQTGTYQPNGALVSASPRHRIGENAAIYVRIQLDDSHIVTKCIPEINFVSSTPKGNVIELGNAASRCGNIGITCAKDQLSEH